MKILVSSLSLLAGFSLAAGAATIVVQASLDNTMYEPQLLSGVVDFSNGAGAYLFVGKTGADANFKLRRALIEFDIAAAVPAGSIIDSVTLTMNVSRVSPVPSALVGLHRVSAAWGEGNSDAGAPGGSGFPSQIGDASWFYRNYNTDVWANPGGDFVSTVSAQTLVLGVGSYNFSGGLMTADVQSWLNNPAGNFGWVLLGDETTDSSARRFDSSENATAAVRPSLSITYSVPEPAGVAVLSVGAILLTALRRRR